MWGYEIFSHQKKGAHVISFLEKKSFPPMASWATEKFQLPFDGGGVSNGDQIFSIAI
jgi:hypothetical protein